MNSICKLKVFSEICSACYQVHCWYSITKFPLSLSPDYNLREELSHGISQSLYSPSPCDPNVGLARTYGLILLIKPLGSALRAKLAPLPGGPYCSASGSWRQLSVHHCTAACGSWRAGRKVRERRACYVCRVMKPNSFNANKKKEKVWGKSHPTPDQVKRCEHRAHTPSHCWCSDPSTAQTPFSQDSSSLEHQTLNEWGESRRHSWLFLNLRVLVQQQDDACFPP